MKPKLVKIFTFLVLLAFIVNQIYWMYNVYTSYKQELTYSVTQSLEKAVFIEINERHQELGGYTAISLLPRADTARYIEKKITTQDTTFLIRFDTYDPFAEIKFNHTMLDRAIPLRVERVKMIFIRELLYSSIPHLEAYLEYIDLAQDSIIDNNKVDVRQNFTSIIESDIVMVDSNSTKGIKAYVASPMMQIFEKMINQLVVSILLILIAGGGMIVIARTLILQNREEKMRQDSINAMTHEFKRPITAALYYIGLQQVYMEMGKVEKVNENIKNTLNSLNSLTAYTERINKISNNKKEMLRLDKTEVKIPSLFETTLQKYSPENKLGLVTKPLEINLSIETCRKTVFVDKTHFTNVMENLIENALKYSFESVSININVTDRGNFLRISVADNGIGMSDKEKKYIFERFYRSKSKNANAKPGLGLGLTYVKSIIEAHGGKIDVMTELNKGSEFIIYIPV